MDSCLEVHSILSGIYSNARGNGSSGRYQLNERVLCGAETTLQHTQNLDKQQQCVYAFRRPELVIVFLVAVSLNIF